MRAIALAWQFLRRDLRSGELRLLGIALIVAIGSLTSVGFFTDRLTQALTREANQLLGGDLLLAADHPWSPAFKREAERLGLRMVNSVSFVSMATAGDRSQLAGVKAIEPSHPLRGVLRTAPALNHPDEPAAAIPERGSVWLDERLTAALNVGVGDRVVLGDATFRVAAVLTFESDRGANFFSIVPRLMVPLADLAVTGLIQPGSRVTYRLHVAGEPSRVRTFQRWAEPRLERGEQLEDIENARPEVRAALDRAQRFLRLAALIAVVLAAVAVGLASNRFMQRHTDGCAVMRCIGARQVQLATLFLSEFLLFGAIASALGCAVGYLTQLAIERVLAGLLNGPLPSSSWLPVAHGYAVGVVLMAGFVVPQLLRLADVPTLRVLRREWSELRPSTWASYAAGTVAIALLVFWIAEDVELGAIVIAGFAGAGVIYAALARVILTAIGRLRTAAGAGWRHGLASLRRRQASSLVQAMAIGIGLTALLLLTVARGELLAAWQGTVPADAPNRFVLNIQPDQREAFRAVFVSRGIPEPDLLPMVRGRLISVNQRPARSEDYSDERAQRLVEREFNLSYMSSLPPGNVVSAGRWFGAAERGAPQFSVEEGLAATLGLRMDDVLGFEVGGARIEARITSLRRLEWDSMRVNFFVVTPPGVLDGFPVSYITSFHLPAGKDGFVNELVGAFPNITVVDVAAVLRQFQAVMDQLAGAVQFVFAFALIAGMVVLFAALESTHDERGYEIAVMRTLGARDSQLRAALIAEFSVLGAVAGALGGGGAAVIGWVLAAHVFKLPYQPGMSMPVLGLVVGAAAVVAAGLLGTASILRQPAVRSLRAMA